MDLPVNYEKINARERKRVREEYARLQGNKCSHCGASLIGDPSKKMMQTRVDRWLFPRHFFKWPIHLHHDHNTGLTIGAVHNRCNAILWQYYGE